MEGATDKFTGDEACRIYLQAAIVYERVRKLYLKDPASTYFLVYAEMDVGIRSEEIDDQSNYGCQETFNSRGTHLAYRLVAHFLPLCN